MNGKSSHATTDSKNKDDNGKNPDTFSVVNAKTTKITDVKHSSDTVQRSSTGATNNSNAHVSVSTENVNSFNERFSAEFTGSLTVQNGQKPVVKNGHSRPDSLSYLENDHGFVTFKGFDRQSVVVNENADDNNAPNRKKNNNKFVKWILSIVDELRCINRDKGRKDDSTYFSYRRM